MIGSVVSMVTTSRRILLAAGPAEMDAAGLVTCLAIVVGLLVTASLLVRVINRSLRYWRHESQLGLFHGLCRAHGLPRDACRLLRRIARYHRLRQPARLFTEPCWLDPSGDLLRAFRSRLDEIGSLRNRLFT